MRIAERTRDRPKNWSVKNFYRWKEIDQNNFYNKKLKYYNFEQWWNRIIYKKIPQN